MGICIYGWGWVPLLSPHPPPVLPVQRRDHLGPVQPVQESVPRDLSLYSVLYYSLCIEMFPREYLPTQGRDDSSTAGVFQCTVLYNTILYKTFCVIASIPSYIEFRPCQGLSYQTSDLCHDDNTQEIKRKPSLSQDWEGWTRISKIFPLDRINRKKFHDSKQQ